jgi:3-isopropylmalate/(R)-2-methylmalate dehydratase small subunit
MTEILTVSGIVGTLDAANIDTDQIIPARFLLKSRDSGYADLMFRDLRFTTDGNRRPGFPLDRDMGGPIKVLVANENFGCGSAREQAVYALKDFGIDAVIAPSFGEIFYRNCIRNGVVPAIVSKEEAEQLRAMTNERTLKLQIDLSTRRITAGNYVIDFSIDPGDAERIMSGRDEIDETMTNESAISAYEAQHTPLARYSTR